MPAAHGVTVWSSESWRTRAVEWLDEQLAGAGIARTGDVEQPRVRPWATVLRAPTTHGPVWLKAAAPATAFEVGLYDVLTRAAPDQMLMPIAADVARGWLVLPDGGPPLGELLTGAALGTAMTAALTQYAELQLTLAPHVDEILASGVPDMRPGIMPSRFDEALAAALPAVAEFGNAEQRAALDEVAGMRPQVAAWCEELAATALPASIDHNDLHPGNVLGAGDGAFRLYDWGDSVVAHPFAVMLVPLTVVRHLLGGDQDGHWLARARDSYLNVFRDAAPGEDLVRMLELACRVGKIARALTWERAVRAAHEQGERVDDDWATAAYLTLLSVRDESYLVES